MRITKSGRYTYLVDAPRGDYFALIGFGTQAGLADATGTGLAVGKILRI